MRSSNVTPIGPKAARRATNDAELGISWFNALSERQRLEALLAAHTSCPASAWNYWRYGFACEGAEHE